MKKESLKRIKNKITEIRHTSIIFDPNRLYFVGIILSVIMFVLQKKGGQLFSFSVIADGSDFFGFGGILLDLLNKDIGRVDYLKLSYCIFFATIIMRRIDFHIYTDEYKDIRDKFHGNFGKGMIAFFATYILNCLSNIPAIDELMVFFSKWCNILNTLERFDEFSQNINPKSIFAILVLVLVVILKLTICLLNIISACVLTYYLFVFGAAIIAIFFIFWIIYMFISSIKNGTFYQLEIVANWLDNIYINYLDFIDKHHFWGSVIQYIHMVICGLMLPFVDSFGTWFGHKVLDFIDKITKKD